MTPKNWYRLLVKTSKEVESLIYWDASPIEDSALKTLPVPQQVQLFRVILEHWIKKCSPVGEINELPESNGENRFTLLGSDDKGDNYWKFNSRLFREEMQFSDIPSLPADATTFTSSPRNNEDSSTPRSARLKTKRERTCVLNWERDPGRSKVECTHSPICCPTLRSTAPHFLALCTIPS